MPEDIERGADPMDLWRRSVDDPDAFWLEQARALEWDRPPSRGLEYRWDTRRRVVRHAWFADGTLNVSVNCLDRHLAAAADRPALIWQGEPEEDVRVFTYRELHREVCRLANVLKANGVGRGDRVAVYLPMIPELAVTMLACARIGAIHAVVFSGYSADAAAFRMADAGCTLLVTAAVSRRGGKVLSVKESADEALKRCPAIRRVLVVGGESRGCPMRPGRDAVYREEVDRAADDCLPEVMGAEDPLFILYTSGASGQPKGVVHSAAGYLLQAALTHRWVFGVGGEVTWTTADIGWITGHTYGVYAPLANGLTTLLYEGVPTWPDPGRPWRIVDRFGVTAFYTAPTAVRALMRLGDEWPGGCRLDSLRVLGSVGELMNAEAWRWYHDTIGRGRCDIVDTWWQTETGGIMIAPWRGQGGRKPGCVGLPLPGVDPVVVRDDGTPCPSGETGKLCIQRPWPGMLRTLWGDHDGFVDAYFTLFADRYFTGDACLVDEQGDFRFQGRVDDVVNVSGHRISTAEVENVLASHPKVEAAAVTPVPHDIKGQGLYAFVSLADGVEGGPDLERELIAFVRREIGPIAQPEAVQIVPSLPRTRSGKVMRRILRKVAENATGDLGDVSSLADPSVVEALIKGRRSGR